MLGALLIAADRVAARTLEQLADESQQIEICKVLDRLPQPYELARMLSLSAPDIVLLDINQTEDAAALTEQIHLIRPDTAVLGLGSSCEENQTKEAVKAGFSHVLWGAVTCDQFLKGIEQAMQKARPALDYLLAFLPAKAGSGCSTICLNVAGCLANTLGKKTLVLEADIRSGMLSFLLNVTPKGSIVDALRDAAHLDDVTLHNLVARSQGLDLLLTSRPKKAMFFSWADYHALLQFAKSRYDTVVVDLPELVNDATVEVVRRARSAFIVATAELASLALARQRYEELVERGMPRDRLGVILNRWQKYDKLNRIEESLGAPIAAVFENDYRRIQKATAGGRLVDRDTGLGKAFSGFAVKISGAPVQQEQAKSRFASLLRL